MTLGVPSKLAVHEKIKTELPSTLLSDSLQFYLDLGILPLSQHGTAVSFPSLGSIPALG